jgi:hypothetical protein
MSDMEIMALIAVALLAIGTGAAVWWMFRSSGVASRRRIGEFRKAYEPLFADLWSDEMPKRLAALLVVQRIVRSSSEAAGIADVLLGFVRHRLSAPSASEGASFDDVILALSILASRPVRSRRKRSGQGLDLSGINFRAAALFGADLRGFRLVRCDFSDCQLINANLSGADLAGAVFVGANLRRADLSRADLSDANLSGADLTEARLRGTKLVNANIGGAILIDTVGLDQEQLDGAFGDAGTAIPEQFRFVPVKSQRA